MPKTSGHCHHIRLALVALALCAGAAQADDYGPVNELLRNGQLPQAMARADQYLAKNPRDPQMRFLKALIQQDAGDQAQAIATYTRLIEDYPELPEPYNNLGVLYAAQGQIEKARTTLEMASRASRSYAVAYENLGDVYAHLASQAYSQALRLDSTNTTLTPKLVLIRQLIRAPAQARAATTGRAATPATPASGTK